MSSDVAMFADRGVGKSMRESEENTRLGGARPPVMLKMR